MTGIFTGDFKPENTISQEERLAGIRAEGFLLIPEVLLLSLSIPNV